MTDPSPRLRPAADLLPGEHTPSLAGRHPQRLLDLIPSPRQDFDNFVTGDNAELVGRLRAGLPAAGAERFLYLWGVHGSGCTHLLRAAAGAAGERGRYMDLADPDGPIGIELLAGAHGAEHLCVALDHVETIDAAGEQRLFNLCNTLRQERPQCMLIVAGSRPPGALGLRADLVTRLSWGLTYEVRALTEAQKAAAMAAHAAARGMSVGGEVHDWLLQTMPRDMHSLLAALDALDRYSLAAKRAVTLPLAREWLRSLA